MQRRGGSGQPVKGQRAIRPKARKAPTAPASADHSAEQFDRLKRERDEALERETAAADILRVIASSPGNTQPVFDAIVQSGLRLFPQATISIAIRDGELVRAVAVAEPDPARAEAWIRRFPNPLRRDYMHGRAILDGKMMDFPDVEKAPADLSAGARNFLASGYRAVTIMPMIRNDVAIGALSVVRLAPGPLSDKQREVLRTFAAQAVIAIENTRLLSELRESLQQQTATADVLKVISRSTFDLQTVLNTLVKSACRLCDAKGTSIWRPEGDAFKLAANFGDSAARIDAMQRYSHRPGRETCTGRVLLEGRTVQIPDCEADPEYKASDVLRAGGNRAMLGVPLLREGLPIGVLTLTRSTTRPFTDKQIELATTFADQAVIAIENARLFDEVQARTRELSESLEQQTATSEVLKVISSSPGELTPVFEAMLANAVRICEAKFGTMFLREGDAFRTVALHNAPPAYAELRRRNPVIHPHPSSALPRLVATKQVVHISDILVDEGYLAGAPSSVAIFETAGARSLIVVPMLKDNEVVGAILIYRQEVQPFTDKQIELLQNFAAQAVIAIENTRLLNELRESLQQQTATADVLKVISRSTFDLQMVLSTLVEFGDAALRG